MSTEHPAQPNPESPDHSCPLPVIKPPPADGETYRLSSPSPMLGDPDAPPVVTPMHTIPKLKPKKSKRNDFWALWSYNGLVFITSVCVMTLELTASRLIQKSVGSSLYTWTSVIGVVLAGITLGNFLGGWLADRFDRGRALAWMYLMGSIACASVLWLDQLIAPMSRPAAISLPTWVLIVVSTMFLLPSLALGTISPLVASMALARSSRTGATVGNVYAWGALGSIVGTFLTGFYLMDEFGTRSIVGLTSGTLGILAVVVAGAPRLFRVAVACGWLQLLGWMVLAATCTEASMVRAMDSLSSVARIGQEDWRAAQSRLDWTIFGAELGKKLQELGLLLKLRDDRIGTYYDESSYSTIAVTEGPFHGHMVKYLRLDKLIHSYYDPTNPTDLHYEYEQVYAAVTKRTAAMLTQPVTLSTKALPPESFGTSKLPTGVKYNAESQTLRVELPSQEVFDTLLNLTPDGEYWKAIDQLYLETNKPLWGGYSFAAMEHVPEGLTFPDGLTRMIILDRSLGRVTAYESMPSDIHDQLIDLSPRKEWYHEVMRARGQSRRATALFIGGGGFIFPRWFLKEFPGSPRIDVAELDPAVYRAAIEAMGLTGEEQQRITTTIGDARNVIDDRLRANQRLIADGKPPVRYDFIYGDAFNDFCIPAHLTTVEFLHKVNSLLSEDGVFQANMIDVYSRFEYPGATSGEAETIYSGPLPVGLMNVTLTPTQYVPVHGKYAPLEIKPGGVGAYRIRVQRTITEDEQSRLAQCEWPRMPGNDDEVQRLRSNWEQMIGGLSAITRTKKPFLGAVPARFQAAEGPMDAWKPGAEPWGYVETYNLGNNRYVLGFRGLITQAMQKELAEIEPRNAEWQDAVRSVAARSRRPGPGRFLGRYVNTAATVFPNIYLFSTSSTLPGDARDTFVMVCSRKPLDLRYLKETGDWKGEWFAALETPPGKKEPHWFGQMAAVLSLAEDQVLTDDFAPVDNLLSPVFAEQN